MASPVVPTLAPHIDMVASIVGTPLDLPHLIVGVRLGPLALCAPPHHGRGHHWPLTKVGSAFRCSSLDRWLLHPSRGWSSDLFSRLTAWWGSGRSTLFPGQGVCISSFPGQVLGDFFSCPSGHGLSYRLLCGSLPQGGLPYGALISWPRAQYGSGSTSEAALQNSIQV